MKQLIITVTMLAFNASGCVMMWENNLSGRVTDSANNPIEGVAITVVDPDTRYPKDHTKTATTDATGVYFIDMDCSGAFPNGGYCPYNLDVTATKAGFTEFRGSIKKLGETKVYDIKMQ